MQDNNANGVKGRRYMRTLWTFPSVVCCQSITAVAAKKKIDLKWFKNPWNKAEVLGKITNSF